MSCDVNVSMSSLSYGSRPNEMNHTTDCHIKLNLVKRSDAAQSAQPPAAAFQQDLLVMCVPERV